MKKCLLILVLTMAVLALPATALATSAYMFGVGAFNGTNGCVGCYAHFHDNTTGAASDVATASNGGFSAYGVVTPSESVYVWRPSGTRGCYYYSVTKTIQSLQASNDFGIFLVIRMRARTRLSILFSTRPGR